MWIPCHWPRPWKACLPCRVPLAFPHPWQKSVFTPHLPVLENRPIVKSIQEQLSKNISITLWDTFKSVNVPPASPTSHSGSRTQRRSPLPASDDNHNDIYAQSAIALNQQPGLPLQCTGPSHLVMAANNPFKF